MDPLIVTLLLYLKGLGIEPMNPQIDRPDFELVTKQKILELNHGQSAVALCINGKIYVDKSTPITTCEGKAVIAHELVHYTQNYCPLQKDLLTHQWYERQAYAAQNSFLRDHGCSNRVFNHRFTDNVEYYENLMRPIKDKDRPCMYGCLQQDEKPDTIRKRMDQHELNP